MAILYSVFIHFYGLLIHTTSIFYKKSALWVKLRVNWEQALSQQIEKGATYYWLHCASAGEFEQSIPLITNIKKLEPKVKIAVSFFSPSGYKMYCNSKIADLYFNIPLDTPLNAKKVITLVRPKAVIFVRNEIWRNILLHLKKNHIPTYLVNFNPLKQTLFFYKKYLQKTLPFFTKIYDTSTYGNTKLERVKAIKEEDFTDSIIQDFSTNSLVIILGSSWPKEEEMAAKFYQKYNKTIPSLKIIIAPHEAAASKKVYLEDLFGAKIISYQNALYSNQESRILLLDRLGILKFIYRFSQIAFIGGGFEKTVHNTAEAAVYGIPILFGPKYQKFEEALDFIESGIGFSVKDYSIFEQKMLELIEGAETRDDIKNKIESYFLQQENCSARIIADILN